jgi:hypothetical protein
MASIKYVTQAVPLESSNIEGTLKYAGMSSIEAAVVTSKVMRKLSGNDVVSSRELTQRVAEEIKYDNVRKNFVRFNQFLDAQ